jgi:multidrug efflux system membrane fusion protein
MRPRSPFLLMLATALAAGCGGDGQGGGAAGRGGPGGAPGAPGAERRETAFPVEVETVPAEPVEYVVDAVGSIEAFERVEVTARIPGVVERVRFEEGMRVGTDQPLVEIEPERYRLAAEAAEAAVGQAEAELAEARAGLERRQTVNARNPDLVRAEEVDTWRTRVAAATASLERARTEHELAKLNLRDAYLRAPVAGIIQTRTVQTGQYVQPGTVLATLVRRDPLLLRFDVPEIEARRLAPGLEARFRVREAAGSFEASITHVAASADPASRLVRVTARVDDADHPQLRPGAFAEVQVPVGSAAAAPVVPETAIRPSERGFLAYVVEDERAVERVLELGLRTADGRVEVRSGVKPGERLVVRGAEALRDGAKVRVGGPAAAAGAPGAPGDRTSGQAPAAEGARTP